MIISSRNPHIIVYLKRYNTSLYISEDTPNSRGICEKVKSILVHSQRPFTWFLYSPLFQSLSISLSFCGIFLSAILGLLFHKFIYSAACLLVLFVVLFALAMLFQGYCRYDRFHHYSIIITKHRIEDPGFLKRNKDKIILLIIGALIGSIITSLFTWLSTLIGK